MLKSLKPAIKAKTDLKKKKKKKKKKKTQKNE